VGRGGEEGGTRRHEGGGLVLSRAAVRADFGTFSFLPLPSCLCAFV
jgi:hypothetical protein